MPEQKALIPNLTPAATPTGKRGRGATPRRTSEDPGAKRFVASQPNLTGDRVMRYAFRPLGYWPDAGEQGLAVAFYFFRKLGCLTVATDRVMHGIYKCLQRFSERELCEAIDAKLASLGETFEQRQQKITYVPQPENFFNPDSPLLLKWLAKSPTLQKRRQAEARENARKSPAVANARDLRSLEVADKSDAIRDRQRRDAEVHARKVAAWYEFLWPTLAADEQNAAIQRAAGRLKDELARRDLTSKETEQFLRESARAAASASLQLHHKNRYADLRNQFEAQYVDRAEVVQSSAPRSEARR
jgi:hypothetical protein